MSATGFTLYSDGKCFHSGREIDWYADQRTGRPWIPAKYKTFKSLIKGMGRDGDISYKDSDRK